MNNDALDGFLQEFTKNGYDQAFAEGVATELGFMKSSQVIAWERGVLKVANNVLVQSKVTPLDSFDKIADRLIVESEQTRTAFRKEALQLGYTDEWVDGVEKEAGLICQEWFGPLEKQAIGFGGIGSVFKGLAGAGEEASQLFGAAKTMAPAAENTLSRVPFSSYTPRQTPRPGLLDQSSTPISSPNGRSAPMPFQGQMLPPRQPATSALAQGRTTKAPPLPSSPVTGPGAPGPAQPPPLQPGQSVPTRVQPAGTPPAPDPNAGSANPPAPAPAPAPTGTPIDPNPPAPTPNAPPDPSSGYGNANPSSLPQDPSLMGQAWSGAKNFMRNGASWPTALTVGGGVGAINPIAGALTGLAMKFPKTTLGLGAGVGGLGMGAGYLANKASGGMLSPWSQWDGGNKPDETGLAGDRNRVMPGMSNNFLGGAAGAVLLPMLAKSMGLDGIPPALLMALGGFGGYKLLPYLMNHMRDGAGQGVNQQPYQNWMRNHGHNMWSPAMQNPGMSELGA